MDRADREPLGLGHEVALRAPRSAEAAVAHSDRSTQDSPRSSSDCCPHRHAHSSARSTPCRVANGYADSVTHRQADGCAHCRADGCANSLADGKADCIADGSTHRASDGFSNRYPEARDTDADGDARPAASDRPAVGRV